MRPQSKSVLAWVILGLVVVSTVLWQVYDSVVSSPDLPALLNDVTFSIFVIVSAVVAAMIISHQPRNTIGWLLMFFPIASVLHSLVNFLVRISGSEAGQPSMPVLVFSWLSNWSWWLLIGPILLISLLFPTGKLLSATWRWVPRVMLACFALFLFGVSFSPTLSDANNPAILYQNPIGFLPDRVTFIFFLLFQVIFFFIVCASVTSIFVRYRRGSLVERQQVKWLVFAFGLFLAIMSLNFLNVVNENPWSGILFNLAIICIPLAIGAAILRFHLFDIDFIIRRTLVYGSITLLLGAIYIAGVVLLQRVFTFLTGQESPIAIVISTLGVVAIASPLRQRFQQQLDRRFYRSRFNAELALNQFLTSAQNESDLDVLATRLVRLAHETVQPAAVNFWVNTPYEEGQ